MNRQRFARRMLDRARNVLIRPHPFDEHFERVEVVHLARATDRRGMVDRTFRHIAFPGYRIFDAVDGTQLDLAALVEEGVIGPHPANGLFLRPAEVACHLSHRRIWEAMVRDRVRTALICEDDIQFEFGGLREMRRQLRLIPEGWDAIHFFSGTPIGSGLRNDPGRKHLGGGIYEGNHEGRSTMCYALSLRGAEFLIEMSTPIYSTADGCVGNVSGVRGRERGLKGYIVSPFPCRPRGASLIGYQGIPPRIPA